MGPLCTKVGTIALPTRGLDDKIQDFIALGSPPAAGSGPYYELLGLRELFSVQRLTLPQAIARMRAMSEVPRNFWADLQIATDGLVQVNRDLITREIGSTEGIAAELRETPHWEPIEGGGDEERWLEVVFALVKAYWAE